MTNKEREASDILNIPDLINDFLVEVREREGFANDKNFDKIAAEVFKQKIRDVIEHCAKIVDGEFDAYTFGGFNPAECFRDAARKIRAPLNS